MDGEQKKRHRNRIWPDNKTILSLWIEVYIVLSHILLYRNFILEQVSKQQENCWKNKLAMGIPHARRIGFFLNERRWIVYCLDQITIQIQRKKRKIRFLRFWLFSAQRMWISAQNPNSAHCTKKKLWLISLRYCLIIKVHKKRNRKFRCRVRISELYTINSMLIDGFTERFFARIF